MRRTHPLLWSAPLAILLGVLMALPGAGGGALRGPPGIDVLGERTAAAGNYSVINYTSSVDGAALSYLEWLPAGYSAERAYPLAVFLHGLAQSGSELLTETEGPPTIANASAFGFILISLNTRTSAGFYVNSPYTGPQEQDVLDAISHEAALRSIRSDAVFLFGTSMGSIGAWSIAGHHPTLFRGIGAIAECPEVYMANYWHFLHDKPGFRQYLTTTGGQGPKSAYYRAQTYYLDSARYYPSNYSGLRLYAVQGSADNRCPNNLGYFGYQQSNNTFLNATCLVVTAWGQPVGCQVPFTNFSAANPGQYPWRFVYEPGGLHSYNDLNPRDLFRFWTGKVGVGLYCATMGQTPGPCP